MNTLLVNQSQSMYNYIYVNSTEGPFEPWLVA